MVLLMNFLVNSISCIFVLKITSLENRQENFLERIIE